MDLSQTFTDRKGGYNRIQIMLVDSITSFPNLANKITTNPEQIVSNAQWSTLQLTPGSIAIVPKPTRSEAGAIIPIQILGLFPDDDPDSFAIIKQFDRRKCIVRVRANSGKEKLYGTKQNPLRFSYTPVENKKTTDTTGYQIILEGTLINDPVFIITPNP